jgi:hypothetical protein
MAKESAVRWAGSPRSSQMQDFVIFIFPTLFFVLLSSNFIIQLLTAEQQIPTQWGICISHKIPQQVQTQQLHLLSMVIEVPWSQMSWSPHFQWDEVGWAVLLLYFFTSDFFLLVEYLYYNNPFFPLTNSLSKASYNAMIALLKYCHPWRYVGQAIILFPVASKGNK